MKTYTAQARGKTMIYTLTTNPAIDMNISTNGIKRKLVNRTSNAVYSPNGKGLNVTFVLGHYGIEKKKTLWGKIFLEDFQENI